ncbi:Annexin_2 [Hexamita inflata]|uniref:Annexin_2 n=1 Tax=Hexamita inflata TaxID=28002 RepID=A0ABP1IYX0_9EUKA
MQCQFFSGSNESIQVQCFKIDSICVKVYTKLIDFCRPAPPVELESATSPVYGFPPLQKMQPADHVQTAQDLHLALQTPDQEQQILDAVLKCAPDDLVLVCQAYAACYGKCLRLALKKYTSGHFGRLVDGCFEARYRFWAERLHDAFKGSNDKRSIIELVLMADQEDFKLLREAYFLLYRECLVHQIGDELGKHDWAHLVHGWANQFRYARNSPDLDAEHVYHSLQLEKKEQEEQVHEALIRVLCTSTAEEFQRICASYEAKYATTLRQAIEKKYAGRCEQAFLIAHDYLLSPAKACAFVLHQSLKASRVRDRSLISTTVLFRNLHAADVNASYATYGNLALDLKDSLKGWYEKAEIQLWGANVAK